MGLHCDRIGFRNQADLSGAGTVVSGDSMGEDITVSNNEVVTSVLQGLEGKTSSSRSGPVGHILGSERREG
jgi:hypothetical protein